MCVRACSCLSKLQVTAVTDIVLLCSLSKGYRGSCMGNTLGFLPLQLRCSAQQCAWNYSRCINLLSCRASSLCKMSLFLLCYCFIAVRHTSWQRNSTFRGSQNCSCSSWCKVQMVVCKWAFISSHFSLSLRCPTGAGLFGWDKEKLALGERGLETVVRLSRHRAGITCLTLPTALRLPFSWNCWTNG